MLLIARIVLQLGKSTTHMAFRQTDIPEPLKTNTENQLSGKKEFMSPS